ncbi:hypothetical protein PRIC1_004712 [Phytophthora ramorum]
MCVSGLTSSLPSSHTTTQTLGLERILSTVPTCVRVLRGRQDRLIRAEKAALLPFAKAVGNEDSTDDEGLSFVERIRKRRRLEQSKVTYEQLKSIPPTSNVVERFF